MAAGLRLLCLLCAASLVCADVYMHNPRGSNNRLNERSANRRNANRMFDSQNNNRGGYNAGDQNITAFQEENQIYYMKYFQSGSLEGEDSELLIEWTNQHGCGGNEDNDPHKLNCNLVIQYMLQDFDGDQTVTQENRFVRMRNGANTQTQNHQTPQNNEDFSAYTTRRNNANAIERGLHETMDYYDDCTKRDRNMNLFHADQRLRGTAAKYTRQNPNGNRRGYECPEERDYYPYWHPTPWRDIAVLTDNLTHCMMYQRESFNVAPRQHCRELYSANPRQPKMWSRYSNESSCVANGGEWFTEYGYIDTTEDDLAGCERLNDTLTHDYSTRWHYRGWENTTKECLVLGPAPECVQAGWSRVNHLGNGREGVPLNYTWRIPHFIGNDGNRTKLAVVRLRYNISTDDYHPWLTNSSSDANPRMGRRSPVEQNPNVNIGSTTNKPLRLAINTAQFGRTFQDRSHVMVLRPRTMIGDRVARSQKIHNLNVRGKRGNIVQTFPSVEYDFIPNKLTINTSQCIHFQWTGSNTHNNGAPGGDGQTGDAGEGTGGTDRHNIVEIPHPNSNYPLPTDVSGSRDGVPMGSTMFKNARVAWASFSNDTFSNSNPVDNQRVELAFASAGYYRCLENVGDCNGMSVAQRNQLDNLLNDAPASFEGALLCYNNPGRYFYISSRNNNFTNRSQKGVLTVREA